MSTFQRHHSVILLPLLTLLVGACHRGGDPTPAEPSVTASTDGSAAPTIVALPYTPAPPTKPTDASYAFDLDNAQVMPTPTGATPIPAPWSQAAAGAYSADIRNDHKSADGWEVVYSNFSTSGSPGTGAGFFVLYNKYRGIMRFYYHSLIDGGAQNLTGYRAFASSLYLQGSQAAATPLLNFAAQSVVDVNTNASVVSSLDAQPLANATWYVTQYELAYDQRISSKSYENTWASWEINSSQLTGLSLNDISLSTLPFSIQADGVDFSHPGSADNSLTYSGPVQLTLTGPASLSSLQQSGLPTDAARQVLALTVGAPWFRGEVPTQNGGLGALANLPVQAKFYSKSDVAITSPTLAFPGYDNSQVKGLGPQYNAAPGVFYLQSQPTITKQVLTSGTQPYVYNLNVASVKYLFNPAVQAIAAIRNIQQQIIATPAGTGLDATLYAGTTLAASQELAIQGVRVSFDVVPNNGSATIHMVKTFKATVQ